MQLTQTWARLEPELKRNFTPYLHSLRHSVHCCTYTQERHIVFAVPPTSASLVDHLSLYNKPSVPTICSHIWHLSRPLANRDSSHPGLPTGSSRWWGRDTTSSEWAVSFMLRPDNQSYRLHRTPARRSTALDWPHTYGGASQGSLVLSSDTLCFVSLIEIRVQEHEENGGVKVQLHWFLTLKPNRYQWLGSSTGRFNLGKRTPNLSNGRVGWPP